MVLASRNSRRGLAEADDGEEAAALRAFLAVAEEKVATAGGAEAADEDVGGTDASAKELGAIGFAEVEENVFGRGLMARGHHVQPLNGIGLVTGAEFVEPFGGFGELGKKLSGDFGADFVAAANRKSTRLNSSHGYISYAVFCLKKKKGSRHHSSLRSKSSRYLIT